jgi:hypothetical protein
MEDNQKGRGVLSQHLRLELVRKEPTETEDFERELVDAGRLRECIAEDLDVMLEELMGEQQRKQGRWMQI